MYKVLIVDDEVTILEGFHKLFDWDSYNCEIVGDAMDGVSAVHMAEELRPDLIIMDINIPMMNGIETMKAIRAHHEDIQFIIVSGYDDFKYCQEALRLNVLDYILKPVDFEEFGDIIQRALEKIVEKKKVWSDSVDCSRTISQILSWLNAHIQEEISLSRLSQEFHMNSNYISQLFKNEMGVNYHTYLTQIRINKAKRYLKETDLPISEIANLTGFKDYRVFTKVFKTTTGLQPSQYRR